MNEGASMRLASIVTIIFLFAGIVIAKEDPIISLRETSQAFSTIAKQVSPAVVNIQSEQSLANQYGGEGDMDGLDEYGPLFEQLFKHFDFPYHYGPSPYQRQSIVRQGSGFIIQNNGYIVTNNHLVQNSTKITVKLLDGKELKAEVVGTDPQSDIAVIKIDGSNLPILELGDSDNVEVGEWVVALGNPFGLSHSLSAGILSAKGRNSVGIADYENFLQTDAAINPGNSGGPLIDLEGKVIGINTAIFSRSGGYMGIGFAIPSNMAKVIVEQLIDGGGVVRAYLGVRMQELTEDLAQSFNIKDRKGLLVSEVKKESPAETAGFLQGDIITKLDGKSVDSLGNFRNSIAMSKPTSTRTVTVLRNGKEKNITVKLGTLDSEKLAKVDSKKIQSHEILEKIGINVQDLDSEYASQLGIKQNIGVVINRVKPGSIAELAGLRRGSVILEVNRNPVDSPAKLKEMLEKDTTSKVLFLVLDKYGQRYVVLEI